MTIEAAGAMVSLRGGARVRRPWDRWTLIALALAAIAGLPAVGVLSSWLDPSGGVLAHLVDTVAPRYVLNTLVLLSGVGAGVLLIGAPLGWLAASCEFPGRKLLEWGLFLPLAAPAYIIAYAYAGMFDPAGLLHDWLVARFGGSLSIRTLWGAVAVMTLTLYPYVYMLARANFLEQSHCVLEAARCLGRSGRGGFFAVALPLARPALAAGTALALMEALNDFGAVQYFAVDTLTAGVYRTWLGMGDLQAASQVAALLMLFAVGLILAERRSRGDARYHASTTRHKQPPRIQLRGGAAVLAIVACLLPTMFGFIIPAAALGWMGVAADPDAWGRSFWNDAWHSFALAGAAAVVATFAALALAYARRLRPTKLVRGAARLAALGYAMPGAVVAVGLLAPLTVVDKGLAAVIAAFGGPAKLLLTGGLAALIIAFMVRFLAVAYQGVEASLSKVTPTMDRAARSLGRRPLQVLMQVHLPLIRPGLLTALLLVFVDVMKELPASLILRPFDFNTLAIRAYQFASDERLAEAAPAALAIVVVGLAPVLALMKVIAAGRPGQSC